MAVSWTPQQEQAISLRDRNVLVSAAAGSGKTAVLVERILSYITDPDHPVDIDHLLVVTFTKAAAGEMKERIGKAIEERLKTEPENEHLQRQGILLHRAQISTIHGFCTYVIQNYFSGVPDLDPGYRIAEEGELRMIKGDALNEVLEEAFAAADPEFLDFVDAFSHGKNDKSLEDMILKVYDFAISDPAPQAWLERCLLNVTADSMEELENRENSWITSIVEETRENLMDYMGVLVQLEEMAGQPHGPHMYLAQIQSDLEWIDRIISCTDYQTMQDTFAKMEFVRLSTKKDDDVDAALRERVKDGRTQVKEGILSIRDSLFSMPLSAVWEEMKVLRIHMRQLVKLVQGFQAAFRDSKRQKNVLDFSDLEHFALHILCDTENDFAPTEAARELSRKFEEILIDEYQDSNYMQETILRAVSRENQGKNNRFMVGDMKQSIYAFRMARPQLFLEKYLGYRDGQGNAADQALDTSKGEKREDRRIDLSENFRSRPEVLDFSNYIFSSLMTRSLGDLDYDRAAALYPKAEYPLPAMPVQTELLLMNKKSEEFDDDRSKQAMIEAEAHLIAGRIRELVSEGQVYDREEDIYRPVQYRDCVILLRSTNPWADIISKVLTEEGIPSYTASRAGYFKTLEISVVLNYLRLCDNPYQEIPYAAVLRSPIVNCTDRELAAICSFRSDLPIYEAAPAYAEDGPDAALREKLKAFLAQLQGFTDQVPYTPVHEMIRKILLETGYGVYAAALPGGEQREANLKMLLEKAVDFGNTSYHGLFSFIRYIEQLDKYEIDFGEAGIFLETADTVRIMTIHKSKGLEFPIVFVSGLSNEFNTIDEKKSVLLHGSLGIGMDYVRTDLKIKRSSVMKAAIKAKVHRDNLSEEMRVLYVALTRAKEKLILTGNVKDLDKTLTVCTQLARQKSGTIPYRQRIVAKCYLDWILPALSHASCMKGLYNMLEGVEAPIPEDQIPVRIRLVSLSELVTDEVLEMAGRQELREELEQIDKRVPDEIADFKNGIRLTELLEKKEHYVYPFSYRNELPTVVSVSAVKKLRADSIGEGEAYEPEELVPDEWSSGKDENVASLPRFLQKEEMLVGAPRGTAYHRFMECMDYTRLPADPKGMQALLYKQLREMQETGKLLPEEAKAVYIPSICRFLTSQTGRRMHKAALAGKLLREQHFIIRMNASEANPAWDARETIMMQGIIDACFEEDGAYVIVDYKTDRAGDPEGKDLLEHYSAQLRLYAKALEQAAGLPVKERILYSFSLGKELWVEK